MAASMTNLEWARPSEDAYATGIAIGKVWRFDATSMREDAEDLIEEVPVELKYAKQKPIIMMVTPLDIEDFALGFTLTEGIADSAADVVSIDAVPANGGFFVAIELVDGMAGRAAKRKRAGAGNSGCGMCGMAEIASALRLPKTLPLGVTFHPKAIMQAMDAIPALQAVGSQTGTAHGCAYVNREGRVLAFAEDAGRHNAMDKLVGMCARLGLDPALGFCAATSRASYEMAQKAASAGFPMLAAMSGATAQAQRMARSCGLTLCAYARRGSFECLSVPERLAY